MRAFVFFMSLLLLSMPAFGADAVAASGSDIKALAGAFAIAIGALGGALGQGRLAAAAMEGAGTQSSGGKNHVCAFYHRIGSDRIPCDLLSCDCLSSDSRLRVG